jgi:hypothetical protein
MHSGQESISGSIRTTDGTVGFKDGVTGKGGSSLGVIQSISGDDALIFWSCRGKSVVPIGDLQHVAHGG